MNLNQDEEDVSFFGKVVGTTRLGNATFEVLRCKDPYSGSTYEKLGSEISRDEQLNPLRLPPIKEEKSFIERFPPLMPTPHFSPGEPFNPTPLQKRSLYHGPLQY
ncbi:MAG: hypothetical protein JXA43_01125 [Candidatus Diapherotrites archaeon]|nr:hypothetical protein [Candidatus Diapherotrites archaeon]